MMINMASKKSKYGIFYSVFTIFLYPFIYLFIRTEYGNLQAIIYEPPRTFPQFTFLKSA